MLGPWVRMMMCGLALCMMLLFSGCMETSDDGALETVGGNGTNASGDTSKDSEVRAEESHNSSSGAQDAVHVCDDMACLEERFSACERARYTMDAGGGMGYVYEILGPREGKCRMRLSFKEGEGTLAGNSMTCLYNTSRPFTKALQKRSECNGSLSAGECPLPKDREIEPATVE